MRKRTNATKPASSSYYGDDVTMDSDDDDDHKADVPEGVDFQKYAEDILMQRLMAKEKEQQKEKQQQRSTMTGLSEQELLWIAGALMVIMFMVGTGVIVFLVTKKK